MTSRATKSALLLLLLGSLLPAATAVDRLVVVNGCQRAPIWMAHLANVGVGPGQQNVKIEPGQSYTFSDADTDGLGGARYWPKMGCDDDGNNCDMGGSGGPSQGCSDRTPDYSSCAPPIDTKFEATWGRKGQPCNPADPGAMQGCDFIDISLVDGWTLPFLLEVTGGKCTTTADEVMDRIDCSALSVDNCPKDDDLGHGKIDMTAVSPHSHEPVGCYSPCLKLIDDKWGNTLASGRIREDGDVVPYCCTTPPEDSEKCNAGPIVNTKYVHAVHQFCPGVYSFAYDDGMGLLRCEYGTYKLTFFCPEGNGNAPPARVEPARQPAVVEDAARAGGFRPVDPQTVGDGERRPLAQAASYEPAGMQPAAPAPPAGAGAQEASSAQQQTCLHLGCGSHRHGNCACNDKCSDWNDCCEDYATMCMNAPGAAAMDGFGAIQRDQVLSDAEVVPDDPKRLQPALLVTAGLGCAAASLALLAAVVRGKRPESVRTRSIGPVAPME